MPNVPRRDDLGRTLGFARRLAILAIATLCVARAAAFVWYATNCFALPYAIWPTEATIVAAAARMADGQPLYPAGDSYPYEVNWFGPVYFWIVGGAGGAVDANIDQIFLMGRAVTLAAGLGAALVVAWQAARDGRLPAVVAASATLGSCVMIGFGVMARPDVLADTLGALACFLAWTAMSYRGAILAGALLALGVLTKQTSAWYGAAAVTGMLCESDGLGWRRMTAVKTARLAAFAISAVLAVAITVAITTWWFEPRMAASLFGQATIAATFTHWRGVLFELVGLSSADAVLMPLIGMLLWSVGEHRDWRRAWLAIFALAAALATIAKIGADVNYFLGPRLVGALAAGSLVAQLRDGTRWPLAWLALAGLTIVSMSLSATQLARSAIAADANAAALATVEGQLQREQFERLCAFVANPNVRALTDAEELAARQGARAAFVDGRIFYERVTTEQLDPRELVRRIEAEEYDAIILAVPLESPDYEQRHALPKIVADAVRRHYTLATIDSGYTIYAPNRQLPRGGSSP